MDPTIVIFEIQEYTPTIGFRVDLKDSCTAIMAAVVVSPLACPFVCGSWAGDSAVRYVSRTCDNARALATQTTGVNVSINLTITPAK